MTDRTVSMPQDRLAVDRAPSNREVDQDGHLHIKRANISKACINPYYGREIPNADELGLKPDRTYQMLRDPKELEKAAASFNGKPLLDLHRPQTADDHDHDAVAGSVNNVEWNPPYLTGELVAWPQDSIDRINSGKARELSSSYRYDADMTPGTYEGAAYDGVMRNILGNHVALVKEGRAGPDCFVGDAKHQLNQEITMATAKVSRQALLASGALSAYIRPKMAADTKLDLRPVLKGVTSANWKAEKPKIAERLKAATTGKLAADADIDDVVEMLDKLESVAENMPEAQITAADPASTTDDEDDDVVGRLKAALKAGGMSDEDIEAVCAGQTAKMTTAATDADKNATKVADKDDVKVTKSAMDAAIADATRLATDAAIARSREISNAEKFVRPWVGDLVGAFDSAEGVYGKALTALNIKIEGVHPSALRHVLEAQPKPNAKSTRTVVAADSAAVKTRESRFGANASRLAG